MENEEKWTEIKEVLPRPFLAILEFSLFWCCAMQVSTVTGPCFAGSCILFCGLFLFAAGLFVNGWKENNIQMCKRAGSLSLLAAAFAEILPAIVIISEMV